MIPYKYKQMEAAAAKCMKHFAAAAGSFHQKSGFSKETENRPLSLRYCVGETPVNRLKDDEKCSMEE